MSISLSRSTSCSFSSSGSPCSASSPRRSRTPRHRPPGTFATSRSPRASPITPPAFVLEAALGSVVPPTPLHDSAPRLPSSSRSPTSKAAGRMQLRRTRKDGILTAEGEMPRQGDVQPALGMLSATPAHSQTSDQISKSVADRWTPRFRNRTSGSGSEDESSSEAARDNSLEISPQYVVDQRAPIAPTASSTEAARAFTTALECPRSTVVDEHQRVATGPASHTLERQFSAIVSMTPPARPSGNAPEGWSSLGRAEIPATEGRAPPFHKPFRHASQRDHRETSTSLPRSQARFSLLGAADLRTSSNNASALLEHPGEASVPVRRGVRNGAHTRAKTDSGAPATRTEGSVAARRQRVPTFLQSRADGQGLASDTDSDAEDAPPPSPSPMGDLAFPQTTMGDVQDCDVAPHSRSRSSHDRLRSNGDEGVGEYRRGLGLGVGLGLFGATEQVAASTAAGPSRSSTGSSLRSAASSATISASSRTTALESSSDLAEEATNENLSTYTTPFKRRVADRPSQEHLRNRAHSSTAVQGRPTLGVELQATPMSRTVFGSASSEGRLSSSTQRAESPCPPSSSATSMLDSLPTRRTAKRRSLGAFAQELTPMSAAAVQKDKSPWEDSRSAMSSTPARSKRISMPVSSQMPSSLLRDGKQVPLPPLGFAKEGPGADGDDSGVAFGTPVTGKRSAARPGFAASSATPISSAHFNFGRKNGRDLHPFSVRERSALANETSLSDGVNSQGSSPDASQRSLRPISATESLGSPASHISTNAQRDNAHYTTPQNFKNAKPLATAFMSTGLVSKQRSRPATAAGDIVPPLPPSFAPSAWSQTPSVSGTSAGHHLANSASALGLREVVAAAQAHAAANNTANPTMPDTPVKKSGALGDMSSSKAAGLAPQPPPSVLRPSTLNALDRSVAGPRARSRLSHGSPVFDSQSSCSSDASACGESPLLPEACDSPTMNLMSVAGATGNGSQGAASPHAGAWGRGATSLMPPSHLVAQARLGPLTSTPARVAPQQKASSPLPRTVSPPGGLSHPSQPSTSGEGSGNRVAEQGTRPANTLAGGLPDSGASASSFLAHRRRQTNALRVHAPERVSTTNNPTNSLQNEDAAATPAGVNPFARPPLLRSKTGSRPGLATGRKSSFGLTFEQNQGWWSGTSSGAPSPAFGPGGIPQTPTRNNSIKWFEAAQLITTPSPSSRRNAEVAASKRNSFSGRVSSRGLARMHHLADIRRRSSLVPEHFVAASRKFRSALASPLQSPQKPGSASFEARFIVHSVLGSGEFSEAVKAEERTTGFVYAVKRMKRSFTGPRDRLRHLEEVDILRHLSQAQNGEGHANVISLVDAWEEGGHLYVQTELCPLGTLSFFLEEFGNLAGQLDEARLWKVLVELAAGLHHVHSSGILHLDLKPANVFITEVGTLKIGDFGLATRWPPVEPAVILRGARVTSDDLASSDEAINELYASAGQAIRARQQTKSSKVEREGDRVYMAPEVMARGLSSTAADVYSLGLIMLEAAGNVILPDNGEAWHKLRSDDTSDVDLSAFSVSLVRLIKAMMASDPARRPSTQQILAHPVVAAVREKMSAGLMASELDQLPDFEVPLSEINHSISPNGSISNPSIVDRKDADGDSEMSDAGSPALGKDMERSSSASSALGLVGMPTSASCEAEKAARSQERVLNTRGSLVHEPDDFVAEVLKADPDPEARRLSPDLQSEWTFNVDAVNGEPILHPVGSVAHSEDGNSHLGAHFAPSPYVSRIMQHGLGAPSSKASDRPFHGDDGQDMEVDVQIEVTTPQLDEDDDIFNISTGA